VGFIIDTCRTVEGVTLVPVGPLTNVALALRAAPDLADRVAGISLMGGGTFGNRSAVAEFNIWADPEAAAIVFRSGVPLVMTGLDVTHRFLATPDRIASVRSLGGQLATFLADLFTFFSHTYVERHDDMAGAAVHDPVAVLAVTHPSLCRRTARHVDVETVGELTRGMTVIDRRTLHDRPAPTCDVVDDLDVDGAWTAVIEAIASFTRRRHP
jgi:inosine-uridine nucleoside N-ribohydrolase